MTCTCSTPNQSCQHARPKVIGYYCHSELAPTRTEKLGKLRHGKKFSFEQTPWCIHIIFANYGDRIVYQREDGWLLSTDDLDRVVNLII